MNMGFGYEYAHSFGLFRVSICIVRFCATARLLQLDLSWLIADTITTATIVLLQ